LYSTNRDRYSGYALCVFILALFSFSSSYAQLGEYFVNNYLPKNYEAAANNFGVTQNNEGLIFVANDNSVLVFDGIIWQRVYRDNQITNFSIAKTVSGEIIVGAGDGDIALISQDVTGKYYYNSIINQLPEEKRPHGIIRQIVTLGAKTYLLSSDKLVEYHDGKLKSFAPNTSFHARMMVMGKHVFVTDINNQIFVLLNDKLVPVENTEFLANEKHFYCYPLSKTTYAVGYRKFGTYIAHYDSIHPTKTHFEKREAPCDSEILAANANNGCLLSNGHFVITTNFKGAFEIDKNLEIVYRYNTKNGVYEDNIKSAFEDMNGNLWLSLYYGVSYVEINSNLYRYSRTNGISGLVQSAVYFEDKLFIGTDKGLQFYNKELEKFTFFKDFNNQIWYLFANGNRLFIATDVGLYVYTNDHIEQISGSRTFYLLSDPMQPNMLYAGTDAGLELYWLKSKAINLVTNYNLNREIRSIAADKNNNVFFASTSQDIFFLNSKKSFELDSIVDKSEMPSEYFENFVFSYKGNLKLGTYSGIYELKHKKNGAYKFVKDKKYWPPTRNSQIYRASQFDQDLVCYQKYSNVQKKFKAEEKITQLKYDPNSKSMKSLKLNHLSDLIPNAISYDTVTKSLFISGNEGLFILKNNQVTEQKRFNLFLHKFINKQDVLRENCVAQKEPIKIQNSIPFTDNNVSVFLGFTSYETTNIEFCYLLEGRNRGYSVWNKENKISFSNLREAEYTLKVKARTELEDKEYTMSIVFEILPPWYRTVYAYIVYFLLFVAFVYIVVKLNGKRLVALNKKLEQTIEERTSTISHQKEELEHKQTEILDSINYAQRIQRALLASDKILRENLNEFFVFFQPKDVVSGDFYWASKLNNGAFALVTADSTGHGVPGAIMSMLNISCLKESVEAEKLTAPNEILNHTRKKVIETLANDGSADGGKDGMDCSLLCFTQDKQEVHIAAANNPVWIIRNREFIDIKPDKMPVGKHDRDSESFHLKVFPVLKGDVIYTLSDGFPDQFGGANGKKFMSKKLKELLLESAHLPMVQQKHILENTFKNWVGDLEQIDDVIVIGVRI
jgi:serine phosphatase RsbU (regulator of sigma subunit)/ligand-binding sensor domain-containing protein